MKQSNIILTPPAAIPVWEWQRQLQRRWNEYALLAVGYLGLLVYGSLLPFRFKPWDHPLDLLANLPAWVASPRWWSSAELVHFNTYGTSNPYSNDWINLLLYLPLGLLLCMAWRHNGWTVKRSIFMAMIVGASTSWLVECMQGLTVNRVASLNDVLFNSLGALAGALTAGWLVGLLTRTVFWTYCRIAYQLHRAMDFIGDHRGKPALIIPILILNLAAIGLWYWVQQHNDLGTQIAQQAVDWLPFRSRFDLPYESALAQIGQSLVAYLLLAGLLSLQWLAIKPARAIIVVLLGMAMLVSGLELLRLLGHRHRADMTEPALAILAGLMMAALVLALVRAIRSSCRRKQQVAVPFERRRRIHRYGPVPN